MNRIGKNLIAKSTTFFISLVLISSFVLLGHVASIHAVPFEGNRTLSAQAQIDSFNYTEVRGNLLIQESASGDIVDLTPLQ